MIASVQRSRPAPASGSTCLPRGRRFQCLNRRWAGEWLGWVTNDILHAQVPAQADDARRDRLPGAEVAEPSFLTFVGMPRTKTQPRRSHHA
ncbi:hypothetical protein SAMN05444413_105211 [Roseivivax marinus]|nr:hypothetical protein SAMN05444413_105211 [Roseivivax marinus]